MRALFYINSIILFFTLLIFSGSVKATHIRAGEITAERINNRTYLFTLTIYANLGSKFENPTAKFEFGDNTSIEVKFLSSVVLNSKTYRRIYQTEKTFNGDGNFRVSYREFNRNERIKNIWNSVNTPFYVETFVQVTSFTNFNNPVQLTIPPIDEAAVGKLFVHNAGAYDIDGDSISYKLIVPRQAPGTNVVGYVTPVFTNSFTLNPITGDLRWDRPAEVGLYNVAFVIEEWKKGVNGIYTRVGFVTRDMQIEVFNSTNNPPVLMIPNDTCVVAGAQLIKTIRASDPDAGDRINIYAYPSTYFSFTGPQFSVASGNFNWTTQCSDVRAQPYSFVFKAEDVGNADTLTDYKTWLIYVKGPAPTGLNATPVGNAVTLTWNPYVCTNAEKIEIYRISCDSSGYKQQPCETGKTGLGGYVKIGEVAATATSFLDNNSGQGLQRGTKYCYFIVAKFPLPKSGESYASTEACTGLRLDVPVITNATVVTTSATTGSVTLNWLAPSESPLPAPYTYVIQRADGVNGTTFATIASGVSDTTYNDNNLNTLDRGYNYRIQLVGGGLSDQASTTYLSNTPGDKKINLTWNSDVPWNEDSVWIYRSINGSAYAKLVSLNGNPKSYTDSQGLQNCDTACYYVHVFSSFCDPKLPSVVFENNSETSCGVPTNVNPPRAPDLTVKGCEGDLSVFTDILNWTNVSDPQCNNIRNYNVYFGEYEDSELKLIATTDYTDLDYIYSNNKTTAGCFVVTAVNKQGVEGYQSNKVCVDDCVFYDLPNLITPNGDSLNDVFRPFPIPRGVEVVAFKVYNRWGGLVYSSNNSITLNWSGRSNDGEPLSDGIYYFSAEVKYFRRKYRGDEHKTLKGWVQVLDNRGAAAKE